VESPTEEMMRLSFMQKVGAPSSLEAFRLEWRQESTRPYCEIHSTPPSRCTVVLH
jgi:hypothetical protein